MMLEGPFLAEAIDARCYVNIAGSRGGENWAGPHQENLCDNTFDLIVETVRSIIDAVGPYVRAIRLSPCPGSARTARLTTCG